MIKEYLSIVKNREFMYLWISQVLSQLTVNFITFLLLLRLFERTGSSFATSLIWVSYALPAIIVGPVASAFVDMHDRRKIMMFANFAQFSIILFFSFFYDYYLYFSYFVVIIYSLFNQFYLPSEAASLQFLVPKDKLPHANALFFMTQQIGLILGFGLAGIFSEFLGFSRTIFLASLFLLLAFVSVSFLPPMKLSKEESGNIEEKIFIFIKEILEGYYFLKVKKKVLAALAFLIILQVCLAVVTTNLPVIARQLLMVKPNHASLYAVIPAGLGAFVGALTIPRVVNKKIRKKVIIRSALLLLTVSLWLIVLLVPMLTFYFRTFVAVVLFFLAGISFLANMILAQTYIQENTPKTLMGRVFGIFWFLTTVATVIPVLFSATITDLLGVGTVLTTLGFISLGVYGISLLYERKIKFFRYV